jgi:hypothetical protein
MAVPAVFRAGRVRCNGKQMQLKRRSVEDFTAEQETSRRSGKPALSRNAYGSVCGKEQPRS